MTTPKGREYEMTIDDAGKYRVSIEVPNAGYAQNFKFQTEPTGDIIDLTLDNYLIAQEEAALAAKKLAFEESLNQETIEEYKDDLMNQLGESV